MVIGPKVVFAELDMSQDARWSLDSRLSVYIRRPLDPKVVTVLKLATHGSAVGLISDCVMWPGH